MRQNTVFLFTYTEIKSQKTVKVSCNMDVQAVGLHHSHRSTPVVACLPSKQQFRFVGIINHFLLALLLALFAGNVSQSMAATQGISGRTSSGSFSITLVIPPKLTVQTLAVVSNSGKPDVARGSEESVPANTLQQKLCVLGGGMSHYSLQASGSRNDHRMVLNADGGNEVPYQVMLNDQSGRLPINLQTPRMLPLDNHKGCSASPVVSVDLSQSVRNKLQQDRYYGAAQVMVAAE